LTRPIHLIGIDETNTFLGIDENNTFQMVLMRTIHFSIDENNTFHWPTFFGQSIGIDETNKFQLISRIYILYGLGDASFYLLHTFPLIQYTFLLYE